MTVDRDTLLYLESLAKIRLTDDERAAIELDLRDTVAGFDLLAELDTSAVEPLTHILPLVNVTREDAVTPTVSTEELLANAPKAKGGAFLVPRAVE